MKEEPSTVENKTHQGQSPKSEGLPEGPLVCWYGDDFTGAAAVMEVLTFAGLPSILFLDIPTEEQLALFPELRAIGVASTARAQNPDWMDEHLPQAFSKLAQLGAQIIHYKVCTTLDSSPQTGSIGRAIELGAKVFEPEHIPVLVAAPQMRRYQCFGHLFAAANDTIFRLDRHPVMAKHPVTPMTESDVAAHIAKQTKKIPFYLVSLENLADPDATMDSIVSKASDIPSAITIDSMDASSETLAGKLIWERRKSAKFVVGSQGVEYALIRHWQATGVIDPPPGVKGIGKADKIAVVSGSVSPTTAEQIEWSRQNGFECILFDAASAVVSQSALDKNIELTVDNALSAIERGADPLIYTAAGPTDPAVARFNQYIETSGRASSDVNKMIGTALGKVLYQLVVKAGLKRAVISGGDTSGYATQQLGIFALSALAPTIPGAAIFKAHANGAMNGLQLALKGGQMGSKDYFAWVRDGGGPKTP
ncbi:MAG: four-carbon acid sugar kinase family protein [Gammaproteobacteria bacterium]|nr:four-carbon acid sugar kinase family protein [Gammaproteobacteria bacterium]